MGSAALGEMSGRLHAIIEQIRNPDSKLTWPSVLHLYTSPRKLTSERKLR